MRTTKSIDARSRSPRVIPDIHDRILKALETYEWQPTASILYFSRSLGVSESYLRLKLRELEKLERIESFVAGKDRGKQINNYRLIK